MFKTNETFSSEEVAELSGVTARQLQWWDEKGVVSPQHHGHRRRYRLEELLEVSVISELRLKGFSLQKIRKVLRFLQRELGRRLADLLKASSEYHLLTDGRNIFLEDNHKKIIDLLKNSRQPIISVCLTDQVRRLELEAKQSEMFRKRVGRETVDAARPGRRIAVAASRA
jgi:DNA-binding transcriptional MerR regulator